MPSDTLYCEKCNYTANRKSDFQKHLKTKKHTIGRKEINLSCVCGKVYKYASSLYKHKKKCPHHNKEPTHKATENDTSPEPAIQASFIDTDTDANEKTITYHTSYTDPGFPKNFNDIFKNVKFDKSQTVVNNQNITYDTHTQINETPQYRNKNMNIDIKRLINNIDNDTNENNSECDTTDNFTNEQNGMNMFDMVCTIENLEIPYSYYEYSMDDPDIKQLYDKINATVNASFTIKDNKIIIDRENMKRDDIDKHNLTVVNNLLFIAQEQQLVLDKTIVEPYMYLESEDVKLDYYKKVVKMIVFLYGDEIQDITEMLIDSLQMHQREK